MPQLIDNSDLTMCLDNDALYGLCNRNLKIKSPAYSDINYLIAMAMSGITCSFRFSGQVNTDQRKLATNMIPFPRMLFMLTGIAPIM